MLYTVLLSAWLAVTWLLWSGHYETLILALGAASVALSVALARRMRIVDAEAEPSHLGARLFLYLPWLLFEIAKSNLHVAKVILSPSLPIAPRLMRVVPESRTDLGQVIFANSITLTPGTITLDVRDRGLLVHALTETTAAGLASGEMNRRVAAVEGAAP